MSTPINFTFGGIMTDIESNFLDPEKDENEDCYNEDCTYPDVDSDDAYIEESEEEDALLHSEEVDVYKPTLDEYEEQLIESAMLPEENEDTPDPEISNVEAVAETTESDYILQTVPIANVSWSNYLQRVPNRIKQLTANIDHENIENFTEVDGKLLAYEDCGSTNIRYILLDSGHKIPYINDPNCQVRMITKLIDRDTYNPNGVIIAQYLEDDNIGLFTYMPVSNHKKFKVCAFYERIDGTPVYTTYKKHKPEDELVSPTKHSLKSIHNRETLDEQLTDEHKIIVSNINAKFAREIETGAFDTLKDVFFYINDHILNTIDGSYVLKLVKASHDLIRT